MATRKFLFVNTDAAGFIFDDAALSAADVVDLQGAQLSNVKDPAADQDADTLAARNAAIAAAVAGIEDLTVTAGADAIAQFAAVYPSGNDTVATGDPNVAAKVGIIGLAVDAIDALGAGKARKEGVLAGCLVAATAGVPYYMGAAGLPVVAADVAAGRRVIRLGYAKNATDLYVSIEDVNIKK